MSLLFFGARADLRNSVVVIKKIRPCIFEKLRCSRFVVFVLVTFLFQQEGF